VYSYMVDIVVACNHHGVIGKDGGIPWNIKEDLRHFRDLTENHIVIMGRKTYESIPNAPLKKRCNIVITSTPEQYTSISDRLIFTTMERIDYIVEKQQETWGEKIFVIGGETIYKHFFSRSNTIHITLVENMADGDAYFPIPITHLTDKHGFRLIHLGDQAHSTSDGSIFQFLQYTK